jgi:predicted glutamine amidotransferase
LPYSFGFLEGIWYLDIVHNGHVPKAEKKKKKKKTKGGRRRRRKSNDGMK